jgi:hypothetical protein
MMKGPALPRWHRSPERAELLALYAEADVLVAGWTCACSAEAGPGQPLQVRCCQFGVTGREPYPTAVELAEIRHAMRTAGIDVTPPRSGRRLPMAGLRPCPLLSENGRCRIYASRPLGCRTFFCQDAEPPRQTSSRDSRRSGSRPPRDEANAIGRRIADLSARFAPRDPHPRALTKWLT